MTLAVFFSAHAFDRFLPKPFRQNQLIAMLNRHLSHRHCLQAPIPDAPDTDSGAAPSPPAAMLDPLALQRLRDLDPTGASKLMERVVQAFSSSVARFVPQLYAAQAAADAAGIRHVAHTLKSSSSSVGAIKLSQMCADMEAMVRQGQTEGMHEKIVALSTEITAVLDALRHTLDSHP